MAVSTSSTQSTDVIAGLMGRFGHLVEIHKVTTEDGYILELDRMQGVGADSKKGSLPPVLLVHGIFHNAGGWVTNFPSQSPGFLLADAGFDVWLLNTRGTPQSNHHKTLTTDDPRFWEWSFDEIGSYDLAAAVDHIINVTGFSRIGLLSYSLGFTSSLVLLSMRPEYNDKVNILVGYGAVGNITHFTSPLRQVVPISELITGVNDLFTRGGMLLSSPLVRWLIATFCDSPIRTICWSPWALVLGVNSKQLNKTRIPVYEANLPVGSSSQTILHYTQIYRAQNLVRFDYGRTENLRRYSQEKPPVYPLEKIRAPVALFRGLADILTQPRDYEDLRQRLRHVLVADYTVPDPKFTHLDFVFGFNATKILHVPMMSVLRNNTASDA
ncbi:lysosomal acid lipase/cholesteryl ester hydrolase-like [Haemaphysalis longicornis]